MRARAVAASKGERHDGQARDMLGGVAQPAVAAEAAKRGSSDPR